jgi:riboflavin kinase
MISQDSTSTSSGIARGKVIHGVGRGGSQLGYPTANLDCSIQVESTSSQGSLDLGSGVYYGWAKLETLPEAKGSKRRMSAGKNLHFDQENITVEDITVEVHILQEFEDDFYGETLSIVIAGKIREMEKYETIEQLIAAIESDIEISKRLLPESAHLKDNLNQV